MATELTVTDAAFCGKGSRIRFNGKTWRVMKVRPNRKVIIVPDHWHRILWYWLFKA